MSFTSAKTPSAFNKDILPILQNSINIEKALEYISLCPQEAYIMFVLKDKFIRGVSKPEEVRSVMCTVANALVDTETRAKLPKGKLYLQHEIRVGFGKSAKTVKQGTTKSATVKTATAPVLTCLSFMDDAPHIQIIIATNKGSQEHTMDLRWSQDQGLKADTTKNPIVLDIQALLLAASSTSKQPLKEVKVKAVKKTVVKKTAAPVKKTVVAPGAKRDYITLTVVELRKIAAECEIAGRSKMNKAELIVALSK